jgi:putative transposase
LERTFPFLELPFFSKLVKDYDLIAIEDLNVKGMVKNHCLAKAISDVAWSSFVTKLKYKVQSNKITTN